MSTLRPITRNGLRRAARHLLSSANELRASHTLTDGTWDTSIDDNAAKRDHDEMKRLAAQLYEAARWRSKATR